ncbi:hypothetical protein LWI28_016444 [Acer negundo]|uniref:NADP-dependent oxidoreductase domain-containing protein n=1 Tax=Acer negundo TaxID=4023 RepID=A0AAD5JNY6_ACENE|nr:hypothetical protein LWI28_016444 [Acer negundo]
MEYSLWVCEIEEDIIPLCRELGIGIVSYCPLGRGFFGGKAITESLPAESLLAIHPRFIGENLEMNKLIYSRVSNQAAKLACTPPQLALAWLLHQGDDIILIPVDYPEKHNIVIVPGHYSGFILTIIIIA